MQFLLFPVYTAAGLSFFSSVLPEGSLQEGEATTHQEGSFFLGFLGKYVEATSSPPHRASLSQVGAFELGQWDTPLRRR